MCTLPPPLAQVVALLVVRQVTEFAHFRRYFHNSTNREMWCAVIQSRLVTTACRCQQLSRPDPARSPEQRAVRLQRVRPRAPPGTRLSLAGHLTRGSCGSASTRLRPRLCRETERSAWCAIVYNEVILDRWRGGSWELDAMVWAIGVPRDASNASMELAREVQVAAAKQSGLQVPLLLYDEKKGGRPLLRVAERRCACQHDKPTRSQSSETEVFGRACRRASAMACRLRHPEATREE